MSKMEMTEEQQAAGLAARKATQEAKKDVEAMLGLAKPQNEKQATLIRRRLGQMPPAYRQRYAVAMQGKRLKTAIRAHCEMCMGWEMTRVGIATCTDRACPLYSVRPHQP